METENESEDVNNKENMKAKKLKEVKEQELADAMIRYREKMDGTLADKCFWTRLHKERREVEEEKRITSAKESELWRTQELIQEDKLAFELDMLKRDDVCKMKMRQQIRECPELQELERQLRTAYTQKELKHQIEAKRMRKLEEELKEKEYSADKDVERLCEEFEKQKIAEQEKKKREYRECLQDQMINNFKAKQEEYKQFLQEKALIDDAARVILEEDRKEEEARMLSIKKTKEDMKAFIEAKKLWMLREKQQQEEEDRRIKEYLEQKFNHEKALQEENRIKQENLARQQELISDYYKKCMAQNNEKEELRSIIREVEMAERAEREEKEKLQNQIRQKTELNRLFRYHLELRMAKLEEEKRKDLEYGQQLLKSFAEDAKLEMLSNEKKKLREINYRKQLKEEIDERHKRRILEAQSEISMQELEEKARKDRRRLIEDERIRLLQEHASKLVGYLPKGLLRESDLPHLGADVQQYYNSTGKI